jgi:hypothetical protein
MELVTKGCMSSWRLNVACSSRYTLVDGIMIVNTSLRVDIL